MEERFLKLTNSVYKVLEFFPESDPLKNKAKDKALAIMDNLVLINETSGWASFHKEKVKVNLLEDIDMLLGYLWIAKSQGWLNSINCLIISNEYEKIKKENQPMPELENKFPNIDIIPQVKEDIKPVLKQNPPPYKVTARQSQILDFLNNHEKAQVVDLQTVLLNVTKRTIRRDLDELLNLGKIVRLGEFNQVFYKMS